MCGRYELNTEFKNLPDILKKDMPRWLSKRYEKQLKNIKNNREFSSLTKEIEYKGLEIQLNDKHISEFQAKVLHKEEVINELKGQISDRKEELSSKNKERSSSDIMLNCKNHF